MNLTKAASELETIAVDIKIHAARLHEATNHDDAYDAAGDLETALKKLDSWLTSASFERHMMQDTPPGQYRANND